MKRRCLFFLNKTYPNDFGRNSGVDTTVHVVCTMMNALSGSLSSFQQRGSRQHRSAADRKHAQTPALWQRVNIPRRLPSRHSLRRPCLV